MKPIVWHGCYEGGWKGIIVPDAFAHPAKFSRALIQRILDHGLARGYWRKGEMIGDPFGGVGLGGIEAAYRGLNWVGNELEPKFVGLAIENFRLHNAHWKKLGLPAPVICQGDSRQFDVVVQGVVTSPPFTTDQPCQSQSQLKGNIQGRAKRDQSMTSDGNIQALTNGNVDAVITSPPYSDIASGAGGLNTKPAKHNGQQSGRKAESASQEADQRYGATDGQISQCKAGQLSAVISSPPYADQGQRSGRDLNPERYDGTHGGGSLREGYGETKGNIGNAQPGAVEAVITSPPHADTPLSQDRNFKSHKCPDRPEARGANRSGYTDAVVTSPPWENNSEGKVGAHKFRDPEKAAAVMSSKCGGNYASPAARKAQFERDANKTYGESAGQIGKDSGETYWQAMALVYGACFRSIKPGGYIAVVVKDYVKNKQRVRLCDDTLRLLEHVGFVAVERIHAMLVEETTYETLFGETQTTKRERKSFFRRLAEKKGSPRIDYEEVLICRKAEA